MTNNAVDIGSVVAPTDLMLVASDLSSVAVYNDDVRLEGWSAITVSD